MTAYSKSKWNSEFDNCRNAYRENQDRAKQLERLRRKAERIREFLESHGEKIGRTGKEIKSKNFILKK